MVLWDQQFKRLGNCGQTAGRVGNQLCTYNAGEFGNGQRLNKLAPLDRHRGGHFYVGLSRGNVFGLWGLIFHQKSGECHDIQRKQIKINFIKIKCTNRYNFAATIPGEAG